MKINIYSVSSCLALLIIDTYSELSWDSFFKKMSDEKNFREEILQYLDEKYVLKTNFLCRVEAEINKHYNLGKEDLIKIIRSKI
jgi:hypothetical protein